MPITMQGSWTVTVKTKLAGYDQRFVIEGSDNDGSYDGVVGNSVTAGGAHWTISIQHDPTGPAGWTPSDERIVFPTVSAGQIKFDIQSNDSGPDTDFNDLILTCSTPQTATDFVVYGNVQGYQGFCINPCYPYPWLVAIDSYAAFEKAIVHPTIRDAIAKLYPERLTDKRPQIGPWPPPGPYRPLVLPLGPEPIPARRAQIVTRAERQVPREADTKAKSAAPAEATSDVMSIRSVEGSGASIKSQFEVDGLALAKAIDQIYWLCESEDLPGVLIQFQQYDRTTAELAGGVYTGTGNREELGSTVTDMDGNYIFRFTRSIGQIATEVSVDVGPGENVVVQAMPDLILRLANPVTPNYIQYESAPHWNVSLLQRIDLCIPGLQPSACQGGRSIQRIGNVLIGPPVSGGARVGAGNTLSADGEITATNSLGPQTQCAAWVGRLDLYGCFLDLPVERFTIKYSQKIGNVWTPYNYFQESVNNLQMIHYGLANYPGDPIGPTMMPVNYGGPPINAPTYLNVEEDNAWMASLWFLKAQISTWLYAPTPGLVKFKIEGFDNTGAFVTGSDDEVVLLVDNPTATNPIFEVTDVQMGGQTGGGCALFTLGGNASQPLSVTFRASEDEGFMGSYALGVRKGNIGPVAIVRVGGQAPVLPYTEDIYGSYQHTSATTCSSFRGTPDTTGINGLVTVDIAPNAGAWLGMGETFCTFAVQISGSTRVTDGYHSGNSYGPFEYLLGIQQ